MPIEYFDFFSVQAKRLELERKFLRQIIQNWIIIGVYFELFLDKVLGSRDGRKKIDFLTFRENFKAK
jgi:hypothetical protein